VTGPWDQQQEVRVIVGFRAVELARPSPVARGFVALTMAEWIPSVGSSVEAMEIPSNPAARSPRSYSAKDRAPAIQPT